MKTKTRALWLATCAVTGLTLTGVMLNIVIPFALKRDLRVIVANPEALSEPANVAALILVTLALLGVLTGLGAFWLYRFFGAAYFDRLAPWRWALFGAIFAICLQIPNWLFPDLAWWLEWTVNLAGALAAFFLARRLIPLAGAG